jgi:hypothetical protein
MDPEHWLKPNRFAIVHNPWFWHYFQEKTTFPFLQSDQPPFSCCDCALVVFSVTELSSFKEAAEVRARIFKRVWGHGIDSEDW